MSVERSALNVERSAPKGAVFLSYASQDAEAAKRICEALRTSGVEVWFDAEGGLEHGDEWDAKIRRQIKECVLFIAVISANTQAREEGYFRIEWDLAAERARGIASGVAFILPIVIDDTREPDALVPDRFRKVQWTRLPGGTVPPDVKARILKLWSHRTGVLNHQAQRSPGVEPRLEPPLRSRTGLYALAAACLVVAAVGGWFLLKPRAGAAAAAPAASPPGKLSEARQLDAQARALIDDDLMAVRENYRLADEFCRRAVALDATDGEVWATAARVSALILQLKYEMTPERKELAKIQVERANRLAPASIETGLAQAVYLAVNGDVPQAERLLRQLIQRAPRDKRPWLHLGTILHQAERFDDALGLFRQAAGLLDRDPRGETLRASLLIRVGRYREAEAVLGQVLQEYPTKVAYSWNLVLLGFYRCDLPAASRFLDQIPPGLMQEDAMINLAAEIWLRLGDGDKALKALQKSPRDFLEEGFEIRPKGYVAGHALQLAGRPNAALAEWRQALVVMEKRLAANPNQPLLLYWHALLQALTGQKAAAIETRKLYRELEAKPDAWFDAILLVALGDNEQAIRGLQEGWPKANFNLRSDIRGDLMHAPWLAAIRPDPRIQALIAEQTAAIERDRAGPAVHSTTVSSEALAKEDKSVAVLPFANLSGDKEQEYFSDGLTEEILNTLARERDLRVPGRASSFSFKGKNASSGEIANALNVSRLVEGSVRKAGNKVRISVSLTRADGFSEELGTFTEELSDVFALQDKVARAVVEKLTKRTSGQLVASATGNPEAYDAYLRGRALQVRSYDDQREAAAYFRKAVEIDPGFALAWVRYAESRLRLFTAANDRSPELFEDVRRAIGRAVELNPKLPEALILRSRFRLEAGDLSGAERDLQDAEGLSPNIAELPLARSLLSRWQLDWEATYRHLEEFLNLDPNNGDYLHAFARMYDSRGMFARADQLFTRANLVQGGGSLEYQLYSRLSWRGAGAALSFLEKLTPHDAERVANVKVNLLNLVGRKDEARALAEKIEMVASEKKQGGVGSVLLKLLGLSDLAQKRALEAKTYAEREMARGNRAPNVLIYNLAWAEWVAGNHPAAKSALEETEATVRRLGYQHRYFTEYCMPAAPLYAAIGEREKAIVLIEQCVAAGYHFGYFLKEAFLFESLRGDPRFEALVASEIAWANAQPNPID